MIPIAQPLLGEEEKAAVCAVIDSGHIAQGERVEEFERRFAYYIGAAHAVAVANGTEALHLALLGMGIGPRDEVITVPLTFIATVSAIAFTGAKPIFVDVSERDYCMDPNQVEMAITDRTRAILPVSLYGQPANLPELSRIADDHGLLLLEDASQAHGASHSGRMSGTWGTGGTFSFYATKNMTTGEGGMLTTGDAVLAHRVRLLRQHGSQVRYVHDSLGYNQRMTDMQAAIGLAQLNKLPAFNRRRLEIATRYYHELERILVPPIQPETLHVFHQFVIRVPSRDEFAEKLLALGVQTGIHYPIPVHRQQAFHDYHSFPITERLSDEILSIPVHPGLTNGDVDTVIDAVNTVMEQIHP